MTAPLDEHGTCFHAAREKRIPDANFTMNESFHFIPHFLPPLTTSTHKHAQFPPKSQRLTQPPESPAPGLSHRKCRGFAGMRR